MTACSKRADNGYYDWNNDLLDDDMISYQPYHLEKVEDVGIVAEMNTMRLLEHKKGIPDAYTQVG